MSQPPQPSPLRSRRVITSQGRENAPRTVVVVAVGVAFAWSLLSLSGHAIAVDPFRPDKTTVVADFPRTVGLYPQSEVRVDGIEAGKVTEVKALVDRVRVTMDIHDVALAADAVAELRLASIIGERFIELGPVWTGDGPQLRDGDRIPMERTRIPAEISNVLDELTRVVEGIDKEALGELVHELGVALDGGRDAVAGIVTGLSDASQTLAARAGEIDESLAALQRVVGLLASRDDRIVDILEHSVAVSDALLAQDGALDAAITGLDGLLGEVAQFTGAQKETLVALIDRLDRVGEVLHARQPEFERVVNELPNFSYGYARAIDHDGDRWYTINGPMGVLFLPTAPAINSRGGVGVDHEDNRIVPRLDHSNSPVAPFVPREVDGTTVTGPGPLLPSTSIGTEENGIVIDGREPS